MKWASLLFTMALPLHAEIDAGFEEVNAAAIAEAEAAYGPHLSNPDSPLYKAVVKEIEAMTIIHEAVIAGRESVLNDPVTAMKYEEFQRADYAKVMADRLARALGIDPVPLTLPSQPNSSVELSTVQLPLAPSLPAQDLTKEQFIAVQVQQSLEAYAKTDEIKKLRAQLFFARNSNNVAEVTALSQRLTAMKQVAEAEAVLAADRQWQRIQQANAVLTGSPVQPAPTLAEIRHQEKQEKVQRDIEMAPILYQNWLLEQQLALEILKFQQRQQQR